jgi:thiamine-phosphate pyrophosphorylase
VKGYYFITDADLSRAGNAADVAAAVSVGVPLVQYRRKTGTTAELYAEAMRLRALCRGETKFLVNDRLDIALAADADGVHIGQDDMPFAVARRLLGPDRIIGLTVHSVAEAVAGEKMGADYLGVSPIFATATKRDAGDPGGLQVLKDIRVAVSLPLAAIGGITLENAPQVVAAGADMVCAISAVVSRRDVGAEIQNFNQSTRI